MIKICNWCGIEYLSPPKHSKSKHCSRKCASKSQSKIYRDEKSSRWKGDKAKYHAIHEWVRVRKLKPEFCERCNKRPCRDLANISGEYKRDINDFEWLCRRCHMEDDGRMNNLRNVIFDNSKRKRDSSNRFTTTAEERVCKYCSGTFLFPAFRKNQGVKGIYCSVKCSNKGRGNNKITINCKECNAELEIFPCRLKTKKFCSKKCYVVAQKRGN